jgi:tetratricopeptide (TPR) repeat protein
MSRCYRNIVNVGLILSLAMGFTAVVAQPTKTASQIERQLQQAVRKNPRSFAANHQIGEFYLQQNQFAQAIPYLEKARQLDPKHYANAYDLALAYFRLNNLGKARASVQALLKIKPTAELYALLGDIEDKANNREQAAEEYQRAARLDESEDRLLDFGNSLIKIGAYDGAVQIFDYSLKKYPQSAKLRVGLGITHYTGGRYSEAVKTLCEAVDLDPTDPRSFVFLGEMYGVAPELAEEVTKRMAQFVQFHPNNAQAHFYYAVSLWHGQSGANVEMNEVERLLRTAISLDPHLSSAHLELGVLLSEQRKNAEAITALRTAIKLKPDVAKAHYRLMQLYQRTGQRELAAQELELYQALKARETKPEIKPQP